jgi:hypothetical protein
MYRTGGLHRRPRPVGGVPGEARPDRVLEHVFERIDVVLFGFDQLRVVAPAEHVVTEAPAMVEAARVPAVEVAHAEGEIRLGCLHDEVVVRSEEAVRVEAPAVAARDATEDVDEDAAIVVVEEDEGTTVAHRRDVVVGTGGEVPARAAHGSTVATRGGRKRVPRTFWHTSVTPTSRTRHRTRLPERRPCEPRQQTTTPE